MKTHLFCSLAIGLAATWASAQMPRLDATDAGRIIRHGDGPDRCDISGMREPSIVQEEGKFYLFYDGCAADGWLACLASSDDLKTWKMHGRMLSLGPKGSYDSGTAASPWLIKDGGWWHMFYCASPNTSPPPELIPAAPYLTMKARSKALEGPWEQQRDIIPFRPVERYGVNASPGHIVKRGDKWLMFFSGAGLPAIARTKDLNGAWEIDPKPVFDEHMDLENTSLYHEESNGTWWMFINHIDAAGGYTDAVWTFWTKDFEKWNAKDRAIVLDRRNCSWSRKCVGMATVTKVGKRLAIFYDAAGGESVSHMNRDLGLAWLDLPLVPPAPQAVSAESSRTTKP